MKKLGVSIVICCYNSEKILPKTLKFISKQKVLLDRKWEVIVIDNNSSDLTSRVAKSLATEDKVLKKRLRLLKEKTPGIVNAREKGYKSAKYEIISFVDDDNWLSPNWIETVARIMEKYPEVGVCGGYNKGPVGLKKPFWYEKYKECYAIGPQGSKIGDITKERGFVWGAGMSIRKSAWRAIERKGFNFILSGRVGEIKGAGEDSELCFALRLAGWRIWYDENLVLTHAVNQNRFTWDELKKMFKGFGAGRAGHEPYFFAEKATPSVIEKIWYQRWYGQVVNILLQKVFRDLCLMLIHQFSFKEGDQDILKFEHALGRIAFLLSKRGKYDNYTKLLRKNFVLN